MDQIEYKVATEVNFSSPVSMYKKLSEATTSGSQRTTDPKPPGRTPPVSLPTKQELTTLMKNIHGKSVILSVRSPYSDNFIPASSNVLLPKPLSELRNESAIRMNAKK